MCRWLNSFLLGAYQSLRLRRAHSLLWQHCDGCRFRGQNCDTKYRRKRNLPSVTMGVCIMFAVCTLSTVAVAGLITLFSFAGLFMFHWSTVRWHSISNKKAHFSVSCSSFFHSVILLSFSLLFLRLSVFSAFQPLSYFSILASWKQIINVIWCCPSHLPTLISLSSAAELLVPFFDDLSMPG